MTLAIIFSVIGFVSGTYLIFLVLLFVFQEKLIFQRVKPDFLVYKRLALRAITIKAKDGIFLQGWHSKGQTLNKKSKKCLIYFGGNAQDTSTMLPVLEGFNVDELFTFNYRGYGLSEGSPSEKKLYSDALEIFDYVQAQHTNSELIIIGHSLGSAIAGYVAKHRPLSKLILLCPLHSISKIGKERFYVPTFAIKHRFELASTAKNIHTETLVIIAQNDTIIPLTHSKTIFINLPKNKMIQTISDCNHNELFETPSTIEKINFFIDK